MVKGWLKGIEAHAGADGNLAGAVEVVGGHGADHRVAARQRVVGQEQHGLPAGRHLDGAEGRAFARQLGRVGARQRLFTGQAKADAVGLRRDLPHLARQQRHRLGREPVGARAHHHVEHDGLLHRGQIGGRLLVQADDGAARHRTYGSTSPVAIGAGPTWASVSVERLPSTGAIAKPPRTARYERLPARGAPSVRLSPSDSAMAW